MNFAKGALSVTASLSIGLLGPGLLNSFKGISEQKATGLGAVAGGFMEALFSPLYWILVLVLFASFYAASHLKNKVLAALFFWIPSVGATALAASILSLYIYLLRHLHQG